ncbi:MAG: deoxyguanosinetriphosphate triphosphohydrolase [Oscillospiraceae bacterium]|nr:deoxyguanosinetriphosphate triphosphohydrolase [Oscillospiraceae bacterium]
MNWNQLLCRERERPHSSNNENEIRTEFRRDYHRIIGSASFRRLQDKAQVYPLMRGDFVRTRLTHSLEVSSFAESLGDIIFRKLELPENDIREDCRDILRCAGLIHDIGNPPFGHFGEFAIRRWFKDNLPRLKFKGKPVSELLNEQMTEDFMNFEGNAQALRIITRLHCLTDMSTGMNLTYALLNTIIKYPVRSVDINKKSGDIRTKKMGFFYSENELFEKITNATGADQSRYPLTYILEAADDIAYLTADIEDAVVKGFIDFRTLIEELFSGARDYIDAPGGLYDTVYAAACSLDNSYMDVHKLGMPDPKQKSVQQWVVKLQNMLIYAAADSFCDNYDAIMDGTFKTDLLTSSPAQGLSKLLGDIAYDYAFRSKSVVSSEISEHTIMNSLLDNIVDMALNFDLEDSSGFHKDLSEVLSENYVAICRNKCRGASESEECYYRIQLATDCISGMTDSYAEKFYRMLNGFGDQRYV